MGWRTRTRLIATAVPILLALLVAAAAVVYSDRDEEKGRREGEAIAALRDGRLDVASVLLSRLLRESPGRIDLRQALTGCLLDMGREDEADEIARRTLEIDPGYSPAWSARAEAARRRGDAGAALDFLREAHRTTPNPARTRPALLAALLDAGLVSEADALRTAPAPRSGVAREVVRALERIAAERRLTDEERVRLARALAEAGDAVRAGDILRGLDVLLEEEDPPPLAAERAAAWLALGEPDGAFRLTKAALAADPADLALLRLRIEALAEGLATEDLSEPDRRENDERARGARAFARLHLGRAIEAVPDVTRLGEIAPDHAGWAALRGLVRLGAALPVETASDRILLVFALSRAGFPHEAADVLRASHDIEDPRQHELVATELLRTGGATTARGLLEAAAHRAPDRARTRLLLAMLAEEEGKIEEAMEGYEEVLRLEPEHPVAANNLAFHLAARDGDPARAERLARAAVASDPERSAFRDTLATVLESREGENE